MNPSRPLASAAPVPAAVPRGRRVWAAVVDTVTAYLPVLLMALLAGGTWWLVKNTPVAEEDRGDAPLRHVPDYEMSTFSVQRFGPAGGLRAQLDGDVLRHYPDTDTIEIDNVRLRAIGEDGRVTVASAQRAIANGDGTEVQLVGGAEVISEAPNEEPIRFRGDFLHAFLDTERVTSHLPVTVTMGETQMRAERMTYDNLERVLQFDGRMRATFSPRPSRPAARP